MSKPRVLIVENVNDWRIEYRQIVEDEEYEAIVATGRGDELIADAIAKCKNHCCHVAIVDMRLRDDEDKKDFSGIDEVALKIAPVTSVIIASGHIDVNTANTIRVKAEDAGVDLKFFNKKDPQVLSDLLKELAYSKSSVARNLHLEVASRDFETQLEQFLVRMGYKDDLESGREVLSDLLVELYADDNTTGFELGPVDSASSVTSATISRNSFVGRVILRGSNRMDSVVKFARPQAITSEYENYRRFIYHRVPWQSYAGLDEKPALSWTMGAIGIDLVFHAIPFSGQYRLASNENNIKPILEAIGYFSDNWTHYSDDPNYESLQNRPYNNKNFLGVLIETWDKNKVGNADTFERRLAGSTPEELWKHPLPIHSTIHTPILPNPIFWLKETWLTGAAFSGEKTNFRVTHGDAWGENLFVTRLGTAIWIDYERTGLGYVLQDFTRLEFDILTRLISVNSDENGWRDIFHLYVALVRNEKLSDVINLLSLNPETRKAVSVITKLRQEGVRYSLGIIDTRQYLASLLVNAVFRATLKEPVLVEILDERNQREARKGIEGVGDRKAASNAARCPYH